MFLGGADDFILTAEPQDLDEADVEESLPSDGPIRRSNAAAHVCFPERRYWNFPSMMASMSGIGNWLVPEIDGVSLPESRPSF